MKGYRTCFDGEWITTSPMLSKTWGVGVIPQCEICKGMSCAPHWYSVKRKVFRCKRCFTPEVLKGWEQWSKDKKRERKKEKKERDG